jgi:hypothetical protein
MDNIIVVILCIGSSIVSLSCLTASVVVFYLINKNFKNLNNKIDTNALDLSDALTKTIELIAREFGNNLEIHQSLTDWQHSMFEKLMQNSSENFNFIAKQEHFGQSLLSNLLDSLGFRSKFEENNIEKPKRTYADPPQPVELEGLKIKDGKSDTKK